MAIPPKPAVRSALKGKTVFPLSRHARGDLGHSPPDSRYREAGLLVTCTGATLRLPMRSVFIFRGRAVLGGEGAFRSALRGVCRVEMAWMVVWIFAAAIIIGLVGVPLIHLIR
jgi:hypothetical protein